MVATFANLFTPVLGEYIYIGGGLVTLVVIILIVMFVARRA